MTWCKALLIGPLYIYVSLGELKSYGTYLSFRKETLRGEVRVKIHHLPEAGQGPFFSRLPAAPRKRTRKTRSREHHRESKPTPAATGSYTAVPARADQAAASVR